MDEKIDVEQVLRGSDYLASSRQLRLKMPKLVREVETCNSLGSTFLDIHISQD